MYTGFAKLQSQLAARGARNPEALAAYIGDRKFGKAKMQHAAATGKSLRKAKPLPKKPLQRMY